MLARSQAVVPEQSPRRAAAGSEKIEVAVVVIICGRNTADALTGRSGVCKALNVPSPRLRKQRTEASPSREISTSGSPSLSRSPQTLARKPPSVVNGVLSEV